MNTNL